MMFSPSQHTTAAAITAQLVPLAAPLPTTIESRRVPVAKYLKLTQSSLDIANKFCVSLGDKTFENVNQLEKALKASCLYTLADGSRLQPVPTTNNIGGYTPPSILVVLTSAGVPRNINSEEDDCFKYQSDNLATLTLFSIMIKPDMNHLIIKALENESATELYLNIKEYFKGHKHHHIEFARSALHYCKFTQHVNEDIDNLRQLITNLEEAQEAPLPEAQMMGVLRGMMVDEQRLNLTQSFNWACLNRQQFGTVLDTLMSMWNNIPYKTVKMAAVTSTGEEKLCFRFQQGNCTTENCIYVHKLMTEEQKKDSRYDRNNKKDKVKDNKLDKNKVKNGLKNNISSGTNRMDNSNNNSNAIPLTEEHYMSIGEPRGNKSDENPRGYSKSQNKLFNPLVMIHNKPNNHNKNIRNNNDSNINGPFDVWGNPSSAPYQNGNTTANFTMAAFCGDGSSPEPTEVFPEKIEPDIIDLSNN